MKLSKIVRCLLIFVTLYLLFILINNSFDKEGIDDNIIYIKDFLSPEDYQKVSTLNKSLSDFTFESFRYSKPLHNEEVYNIFYNQKYIQKINKFIINHIHPSEFPIEHRFYLHNSPGMKWHKDLLCIKNLNMKLSLQ